MTASLLVGFDLIKRTFLTACRSRLSIKSKQVCTALSSPSLYTPCTLVAPRSPCIRPAILSCLMSVQLAQNLGTALFRHYAVGPELAVTALTRPLLRYPEACAQVAVQHASTMMLTHGTAARAL